MDFRDCRVFVVGVEVVGSWTVAGTARLASFKIVDRKKCQCSLDDRSLVVGR